MLFRDRNGLCVLGGSVVRAWAPHAVVIILDAVNQSLSPGLRPFAACLVVSTLWNNISTYC